MCVLRLLTPTVQPAGRGDPASNKASAKPAGAAAKARGGGRKGPHEHAETVAGQRGGYGPPPGIPAAGAGRPYGGSCPTITGLTRAEERLTATRLEAQVTLDMPLIRTH